MMRESIRDRIQAMRDLHTDDVLAGLGLERRRAAYEVILPAVGLFAAGLLVGSGLALLFAPKPGRELRRELRGRATDVRHRLESRAEQLAHEVRQVAPFGKNVGPDLATEPEKH